MNENANCKTMTDEEYRKLLYPFNKALKQFEEYTSLCDAYRPDRDCDYCER